MCVSLAKESINILEINDPLNVREYCISHFDVSLIVHWISLQNNPQFAESTFPNLQVKLLLLQYFREHDR